ncbi:MAG: hydrolase [Clostridiales bacterium]|nr:hydrolase [Clostridiales bacterium]
MTENKKELKPLAPYEEALPYSKYYYREMARPNPELMGLLAQGPMDPDKALPLTEIDQLLDPGYHEVETGYCIANDGLGYVAVNNVFPGCTIDMMRWWFVWHAAGGNLRYRIWDPLDHMAIAISDQDRRKIADPGVPLADKFTDVDHFVVEDTGGGDENILIRFKKVPDMGFDMDKYKGSQTKEIVGGYGTSEFRFSPMNFKAPAIMMHTMREIEGGIEFRTRFWMGARIVEGKALNVTPPFVKIPIQAPMGLAFHNVVEYSNLAAFLPEIYEEYKDRPLTEE